jgi:Fe-S-cluster containining protein
MRSHDSIPREPVSTSDATQQHRQGAILCKRAVDTVHAEVDAGIANSIEHHNKTFPCQKGCSFCCNVRVAIYSIEALRIAYHLFDLPDAEQQRLIPLMEQQAILEQTHDTHQYAALKRPCVFLDPKGECSIYSIRPVSCRPAPWIVSQEKKV